MTIAFVAATSAVTASNGAASLSVNKPAGTLDGHIMILGVGVQTATTAADVTITPPAGWTAIGAVQDDDGTSRVKLGLYWKRANGEGSNYTLTVASTATIGRTTAGILTYSGVDGTAPVVESAISKFTGTAATARITPSITTAGNRWLVGAFVDPLGPFTWTDLTERVDISGSNVGLTMADSGGNTAAGTYTRNATSSQSTSVYVRGLIALQEAIPAPVANGTVGTERYVPLDFSASAAGNGGTITHSLDVSTGFIANGTGKWLAPQQATPYIVTDTITESPSGLTATKALTVPALSSGSSTPGHIRIQVFSGTGTVS